MTATGSAPHLAGVALERAAVRALALAFARLVAQRIADQRAKADRDWAAAWDREIDAHPDDEVKLEAYALTLAAQTAGRIRIAKVWEDMRGKVAVNLDNSYRAAAARRMVARHPALVGR